MAAYCDGRSQVEELDTFLLQHVMWQRIDNVPKIHDWLLNEVSAEFGNKQLSRLLWGIFLRLPGAIDVGPRSTEELLKDVVSLWSTVVTWYVAAEVAAAASLNAGRSSLWLSEEESEAIATAFSGRIASARSGLHKLMEWVPIMEALLRFTLEPAGCATPFKQELIPPLLYGYYDSLTVGERAKLPLGFATRLRDWRLKQ